MHACMYVVAVVVLPSQLVVVEHMGGIRMCVGGYIYTVHHRTFEVSTNEHQ